MTQRRIRVESGSPYEPIIGFSRAARQGDFVAISGTAPIAEDGSTVSPSDPGGQARRCFEILSETLAKLGGDLGSVIRTRVYLKRIEDWEAVASVHGEFFSSIKPASTFIQVAGLIDPEWLVEVEADAIIAE